MDAKTAEKPVFIQELKLLALPQGTDNEYWNYR